MTRRRWIADEVSGDRAALVDAHAEHLARVLRVRIGQQFDIVAGSRVRRGTVSSVAPDRVEFDLAEDVPAGSFAEIHLLIAIFKFDRFEWALEKATELGVNRILPVIASRTDAHLGAAAAKRAERWRRVAREAAEQSRRMAPPELADPARLEAALPALSGARIVLSETERGKTLKEALSQAEQPVTLAIGPEGGWTAGELKRFAEAGWVSASLGATVLRAETAAVAALAIAVSELAGRE
jgi:16S rRNA (uracil1498-N3)-methyltransferase